MGKLFIEDLSIKGKKVLMRVDFNVPLDGDRNVMDATRIEAALPSIRYVKEQGGSLILLSHLGRPKNMPVADLSLTPIAKVLSTFLDQQVKMAPDCIGSKTAQMVETLKAGEILLLENLRFHRAEEHPEEDPSFAEELATFGELYINDAFGTSHRKHASTFFLPKLFPGKAAAGYLLEKEIRFLGDTLEKPKRPFVAILGGAKVSTKIGVIESLLKKVDFLLVGGAMAHTFLKAIGFSVGNSYVEEEYLATAKKLYSEKIILPIDVVAAKECSSSAETQIFKVKEGLPSDFQGLDIGPETIDAFGKILQEAQTILWNGPVGVYEFEKFAAGTKKLANLIGRLSALSIAGGGDLIAALRESGEMDRFTHISTGGGATLEFIEKGTLPGVEALSEKKITLSS